MEKDRAQIVSVYGRRRVRVSSPLSTRLYLRGRCDKKEKEEPDEDSGIMQKITITGAPKSTDLIGSFLLSILGNSKEARRKWQASSEKLIGLQVLIIAHNTAVSGVQCSLGEGVDIAHCKIVRRQIIIVVFATVADNVDVQRASTP